MLRDVARRLVERRRHVKRQKRSCRSWRNKTSSYLPRFWSLEKMEVLHSPGGSMTITKADLATLLHDKLGLNKREAADIVMAFFEEISAELARGDIVKLSGFG